jgi:3-dehydroquinate synthase class II
VSFNAHEPKNGDFATYVEKLAEIPARKMQIIQVHQSDSGSGSEAAPDKLSKDKALDILRRLEQQKRRKKTAADSEQATSDSVSMSGFARSVARWGGSMVLVLGWVWNFIPLPILIFALVILAILTRQKKDS